MKTAAPKISIVITCFNYAQYVGLAIESALRQAYIHKEPIVVNDGSTDDSWEVILRYADRVRIIEQSNKGHIAACNRGFRESTGDVVVFLDADDLLAQDALEKIAGAWYAECAKVQYDLKIINGSGEDLGRRFCNFPPNYDVGRVRADFLRTGTYRWPVTTGNAYSRWFLETVMPLEVDQGPMDRSIPSLPSTAMSSPFRRCLAVIASMAVSSSLQPCRLRSGRTASRGRCPGSRRALQATICFLAGERIPRSISGGIPAYPFWNPLVSNLIAFALAGVGNSLR